MAKRKNRGANTATAKSNRRRRSLSNGKAKGSTNTPLGVKSDENGHVWSHVRQKWLVETPEERVRQQYVVTLHNEYGFALDQMDEELEVTGRGSGEAKADVVIWRSTQDKLDKRTPLIVVECKSNNVTIQVKDYHQGDNYAR